MFQCRIAQGVLSASSVATLPSLGCFSLRSQWLFHFLRIVPVRSGYIWGFFNISTPGVAPVAGCALRAYGWLRMYFDECLACLKLLGPF